MTNSYTNNNLIYFLGTECHRYLMFAFELLNCVAFNLSPDTSISTITISTIGIRSGISIVSVVGVSLWPSISRSLSVVSTIGIWVSSIGISSSIWVSIDTIVSISISLWLSISRSLSVVTISLRSGISVVSVVGISLWLSFSRSLSVVTIAG